MAGNVQKTRTVAVTAQKNATGFIITNMGGNDAAAVGSFSSWTIDGVDAASVQPTGGLGTKIGSTAYTATGYDNSKQQRVIVVAKFNDGTTQVVLDTNL